MIVRSFLTIYPSVLLAGCLGVLLAGDAFAQLASQTALVGTVTAELQQSERVVRHRELRQDHHRAADAADAARREDSVLGDS
jgi:Holliday junction resolvasome RuvABC endonuclease subunit